MTKLSKKLTSAVIAGMMTFSISVGASICFNNSQVVYAASKSINDARARVNHLYYSLHNNYLGIKNQGQWQQYIKGIRSVLAKVPLSERVERDKLSDKVNRAEKLVSGLSRINQVEKSIANNSPRIGNTRQWDFYLVLGEQDIQKVDNVEFSDEIEELEGRLEVCYQKVEKLINDFDIQYKRVLSLYESAEKSGSVNEARNAYEEAKKLGRCEESNMLEYECRMLLVNMGDIKLTQDEEKLKDSYYKFKNIINGSGFNVIDTNKATIEDSVKKELGTGINVSASRVFENPDTGEEVFDIVLSNGSYKLFPMGVYFR